MLRERNLNNNSTNMTKKLWIIVSCGLLLLAAGCAKKEPQTATVSLPSNPTTGYSWKVEQSNDLFPPACSCTAAAGKKRRRARLSIT